MLTLMKEEQKAYVFGVTRNVLGHKCKQNQLYLVEVKEVSDEEEEGCEEVMEVEGEEDITPHISVHVMNGMVFKGYKT